MNTRILYRDTMLYKGVTLINIDRTCDALYWCNRQGMTKTDCVNVSGVNYDIYFNTARGLACAVPVEG